jgi:RNA polymerase sigma-70 factor (ECF subfamily)
MGNINDSLKHLEDGEIVELVRSGRTEGYGELVSRYQKRLVLYVHHLIGMTEEAEDIVQNVFVKAYQNLDSFDTSRKFSSWIYRIAHNEAVNYLKKRSRRRLVSWEDITTSKDKLETADTEKSPEELWISQELEVEMKQAIEKLPLKYQKVLTLRYYMDKSYKEISVIIDKPQNTVGTLLNRAKKKLLRIIETEKR